MKITVCDICGREGADVDTNCFTLPMADETDAFYFSNAHLPYAAEICEDCQDAIQNLINERRSMALEEKRMKARCNYCKKEDCLWCVDGLCNNSDAITIDEDLTREEFEELPA